MTVSFIHAGDVSWASYRYRALLPAHLLGGTMNTWSAEVVVLAKPHDQELPIAHEYKKNGGKLIVDICDDHFDRPAYREAALLADAVTCPTPAMADIIRYRCNRIASIIPETWEYAERAPHCTGAKLLWFGHQANWDSLTRVRPFLRGYDLTTVSNHPHATVRWTVDALTDALTIADIVILPATAPGKSPNRAVEAIRNGCFVVAEPHRSIVDIPGIWKGIELERGIAWAIANPKMVERHIRLAQRYIDKTYSPKRIKDLWEATISGVLTRTPTATVQVGA